MLLLVAQLCALLHEAAVRHVRCAEHGELIDAPAVEVHTSGDARFVGAKSDGAAGDEHCTLASALRQQATASPMPTLYIADATIAIAPPLLTARRVVVHTLYLIAPKTSPPDCSVLFT